MKIKISSDEHRFTIPVPTGLICSRLTSRFAAKLINQHMEQPISKEHLRQIQHAIRDAKRNFPKLLLVDVRSHDGDIVRITL